MSMNQQCADSRMGNGRRTLVPAMRRPETVWPSI